MPTVIDRLKAKQWFKQLTDSEQDAAIQSVMRDPLAQEQLDDLLDRMDTDHQWSDLTPRQEQEQILGVIELERNLRRQRESLEELEWYENLGPDDQNAVRQTVELTTRIQRALIRTVRRVDEQELQQTNPWHHVLRGNRH